MCPSNVTAVASIHCVLQSEWKKKKTAHVRCYRQTARDGVVWHWCILTEIDCSICGSISSAPPPPRARLALLTRWKSCKATGGMWRITRGINKSMVERQLGEEARIDLFLLYPIGRSRFKHWSTHPVNAIRVGCLSRESSLHRNSRKKRFDLGSRSWGWQLYLLQWFKPHIWPVKSYTFWQPSFSARYSHKKKPFWKVWKHMTDLIFDILPMSHVMAPTSVFLSPYFH